jgi:hypothetical protein
MKCVTTCTSATSISIVYEQRTSRVPSRGARVCNAEFCMTVHTCACMHASIARHAVISVIARNDSMIPHHGIIAAICQ